MYTQLDKLASAIRNDIVGGLRGYHTNLSLSNEQLIDDIIDERLLAIKELSAQGVAPYKDLYLSINCIPVECKDIERCRCGYTADCSEMTAWFQIPQLVNDLGPMAINYIGSPDKQNPFIYYTSPRSLRNHKFRKRGKNKPYVWIDTTPNENGMYDCFVFNAPLLDKVSVVGIFKDIRQLESYGCCITDDNMSFLNTTVKDRLTQKKLSYYRQAALPNLPNDQSYAVG